MAQNILVFYQAIEQDISLPWYHDDFLFHDWVWFGIKKPIGKDALHYTHCDMFSGSKKKEEFLSFLQKSLYQRLHSDIILFEIRFG
jgi:hypothetical protein